MLKVGDFVPNAYFGGWGLQIPPILQQGHSLGTPIEYTRALAILSSTLEHLVHLLEVVEGIQVHFIHYLSSVTLEHLQAIIIDLLLLEVLPPRRLGCECSSDLFKKLVSGPV